MLQSFRAVDGQSTYDICLNTYGTLDPLIKMLLDSGFSSVDSDPATGDAFVFDDDLIESQAVGASGTILIGKIYATRYPTTTIDNPDALIDSDGSPIIDFDNVEINVE